MDIWIFLLLISVCFMDGATPVFALLFSKRVVRTQVWKQLLFIDGAAGKGIYSEWKFPHRGNFSLGFSDHLFFFFFPLFPIPFGHPSLNYPVKNTDSSLNLQNLNCRWWISTSQTTGKWNFKPLCAVFSSLVLGFVGFVLASVCWACCSEIWGCLGMFGDIWGCVLHWRGFLPRVSNCAWRIKAVQ